MTFAEKALKREETRFVEKPKKPIVDMTNGEFFEAFCTWNFTDIRTIDRMVQSMLQKRGLSDAPLWEREAAFDHWIREPFDELAWARAKVQTTQRDIF